MATLEECEFFLNQTWANGFMQEDFFIPEDRYYVYCHQCHTSYAMETETEDENAEEVIGVNEHEPDCPRDLLFQERLDQNEKFVIIDRRIVPLTRLNNGRYDF